MDKTTSRRRFRFRLRTLLVFVALLAVALAFGPKMWRRYQLNRAIESTVDRGSTGTESYSVLVSLATTRQSENGDLDFVCRKLLQIVESGTDEQRRVWALNILRMLIGRSGSIELREVYLGELIRLMTSDCRFLATTEGQVTRTVGTWISSTGLNQDQRAALLEAAKQIPLERRPDWVCVLGSIGGRKETLLMLEWADTRDEDVIVTLRFSFLVRSRWPGLLPYFERWLNDPALAELALESSASWQTGEGRQMLVAYAVDGSNPSHLRQKAIEQLKLTVAGAKMLLDACEDEMQEAALSEAINADVRPMFQTALEKRRQFNGEELWSELIAGLDYSGFSESSRSILQELSGISEITAKDGWQDWYERAKPDTVPQRRLLELVSEQPELVNVPAIMRRIVPDRLGYLPKDCMPLYEKMLESENPTLQYWACEAFLAYTDNKEAIPVAIDLISQSQPSKAASVQPGAIYMLQRRFAVNFFWDVAAWKRWWDEHRTAIE